MCGSLLVPCTCTHVHTDHTLPMNTHRDTHSYMHPHTLISHKHVRTSTHTDKLSHVLYCSHLTQAQAAIYCYHPCVDMPDRNRVREERFILLPGSKKFQPKALLVCHHSQVPTDSLGVSFSVVPARGTGGLGQENGGGEGS